MSLSRRRFLQADICVPAWLALLGRRAILASPADAASTADAGPVHHYLAVGDFGVVKNDLVRQQAVASSMIKYTAQRRASSPTRLFMLGDNFYGGLAGKGVRSRRLGR